MRRSSDATTMDRAAEAGVPCTLAVALAFAIGCLYATALFGIEFVRGTSPFWQLPSGSQGGHIDIKLTMSGYYWFVQDNWRWPLLKIIQAGGADGANAGLFDIVPPLAILAKLIHSTIGVVVNPYPGWIVATFGLNAVALVALVRGLGQRGLSATLLATAIGTLAPVVHHRFGHNALYAHWLFVFLLAAYAHWAHHPAQVVRTTATMLLLCSLTVATHIYMYVMAAAIAAAFFLQAAVDRRMSPPSAAVGIIGVLAAGCLPLWAFGVLAAPGLDVQTIPYGSHSMNLLAPFWPQTSGLFGKTGLYIFTRGSIGATAGQYEGYCYIGAGALLIVAVALARRGRDLPGLIHRNWALSLALFTLSAWAVSNKIYFGGTLIASYPLPNKLLTTVLAWFRAEGRLFWPVAWLISALGIAGALSRLGRRTILSVAILAIALQWIDLSIWRAALRDITNRPVASAFGSLANSADVEAKIRQFGRLTLIPSLQCLPTEGDLNAPTTIAAMELQLLAARANAVMAVVQTARSHRECEREQTLPLRDLAGDGVLIAFDGPEDMQRMAEARGAYDCAPIPVGLICTPGSGNKP